MVGHAIYLDRLTLLSSNNAAEIAIHFVFPRVGDKRQMVFSAKYNIKIELCVRPGSMPRVSHARWFIANLLQVSLRCTCSLRYLRMLRTLSLQNSPCPTQKKTTRLKENCLAEECAEHTPTALATYKAEHKDGVTPSILRFSCILHVT